MLPKEFRWNPDKNRELQKARNVNFEQVLLAIQDEKTILRRVVPCPL